MDSGVGGLSVLREILKVLPEERYVYFSDNAFCPYGEKSAGFIRERCRSITELMLSEGAEAMVIACNTATAAAIQTLRSEYDIPFVGMEPAVKPAALGTKSGIIGVLATAGTLKGSKYLNTKGRFQNNVKIVEHVGQGFVELVERGELSGERAEKVVAESLTPLLEAGADTIVLGCTHYPFLLDTMRKIAGPKINFIDPAPAVARRLVSILKERSLTDGAPATKLLPSNNKGKEAAPAAEPLASASDKTPEPPSSSDKTPKAAAPSVELMSSGPDEALRRCYEMINTDNTSKTAA